MTVDLGPSRVVLLRSGGYDYAELDLSGPVHLIAANNVGKTSLIAALQFLYIDETRQMHFSHVWAKTREHYFPYHGSLVLFECATPTGLQVFGLRGLGPVQGHDYQRFAYRGAYDRADVLDDRTPRTWEEIATRLVDRDLRLMEAKHLRASLTSKGDSNGPPLGIVPLKRTGNYESFRFLFKNLLQLSKIDQKRLKELFIDITKTNLPQASIDLRRHYADVFAQVERQTRDVLALKTVEGKVSSLVQQFEERERSRGTLVALWVRIDAESKRVRDELGARVKKLKTERNSMDDRRQELDDKQTSARTQATELTKQRTLVEDKKHKLEKLEDEVSMFAPELEKTRAAQLQRQQDQIVTRLMTSSEVERRQVERERSMLEDAISRDTELVENYSHAVVTWMRERSCLSDDELRDVFTLLNPSLLAMILDGGRISIDDDHAALTSLRWLRDQFDNDGVFRARGVVLSARPEVSPLDDIQDVRRVRERLEARKRRARALDQTLADIDAREALEAELSDLRHQLTEAQRRLEKWNQWIAERHLLVDYARELKGLAKDIQDVESHQQELMRLVTELTRTEEQLNRRIEDTCRMRRNIESAVQSLRPPAQEWPLGTLAPELLGVDLDQLIDNFRSRSEQQQRLSNRVDRIFLEVENETSGRYQGESDTETIAKLADALAALHDHEHNVQKLWTSLVEGMRSAFKGLVDSVHVVEREVAKLTRALRRRKISNLESLELKLVREKRLLEKLEKQISVEEAPLFADPDARDRATRDMRAWFEDRPRIELAELFDLQFQLIDARGQIKKFKSLAQMESEGTGTTIKVLVHLELLRMMLASDAVSVPFFLDEVATLDQANLRALIDHSTSMGFVPVIASPEARDSVETLYFIRPGPSGSLFLDDTSRLDIILD